MQLDYIKFSLVVKRKFHLSSNDTLLYSAMLGLTPSNDGTLSISFARYSCLLDMCNTSVVSSFDKLVSLGLIEVLSRGVGRKTIIRLVRPEVCLNDFKLAKVSFTKEQIELLHYDWTYSE